MDNEFLAKLKERDYDKFLAINFAPKVLKNPLAALFALHLEIADIPVTVSEAMVGHVKIQWWREVITEIAEGKPRRPHPLLLALKGHEIETAPLLKMLSRYDEVLENKLPEKFENLKLFLQDTEVATLALAAKLLDKELDANLALAYAYNRMARQLIGKNDAFSAKLFEESRALLPTTKASVFGAITRQYNKKPTLQQWRIALCLLAGRHELM